jgi:hypothetical protein
VANGDLTQEEADRLKERLDDLPAGAPWFGFGGKPGLKDHHFGFRFHEGGPGFAISAGLDGEALAGFLGVGEEQLIEELGAEGATLASVAEVHGKSRDELKVFIEGEAKTRLDEAVAADRLTQERADQILENLREHIDQLVDKQFPPPGKRGPFFSRPFGFDGVPDWEEREDATPEEQGGELEPASRS